MIDSKLPLANELIQLISIKPRHRGQGCATGDGVDPLQACDQPVLWTGLSVLVGNHGARFWLRLSAWRELARLGLKRGDSGAEGFKVRCSIRVLCVVNPAGAGKDFFDLCAFPALQVVQPPTLVSDSTL